MVEVAEVLDEVVASCETFVGDAVAVGNHAGVFWGPDAVNSGLVALEVGETGEVGGRGAGRDVAVPCSGVRLASSVSETGVRARHCVAYLVRLLVLYSCQYCGSTRQFRLLTG